MMDVEYDGYISKIQIGSKIYKLRCEIVEVHPMTCPKCGASLELHFGRGTCEYCGTHYAANVKIEEE